MMSEQPVPAFGAFPSASGTLFRIWAPLPDRLSVVLGDGSEHAMSRNGDYWEATVPSARAGTRYGYRVNGEGPFPDPYSRSQPDGVHQLSEVVDTSAFPWGDHEWTPPPLEDLIIYELHPGTFTPEGTLDAAAERLGYLHELGITAVELMPVSAFPGTRGWGYDGVFWFAPFAPYGGPIGLQRFVDRAHRAGLAVLLDVVYNHFGPDGNYFGKYTDRLFTEAHHTPWGAALNFDQPGSEAVRELVISNLAYWHDDYHIDGFRLDATFALIDTSDKHVLAEVSDRLRERQGAPPYLIAETHENDVGYCKPTSGGGRGFDATWADDFHHIAHRLLTGESDGYYASYAGTPEELARIISQGYLYEGQRDAVLKEPRGTRAREAPWSTFVYCLQNHDQVGNRATGERLHELCGIDRMRVAASIHLLLPQIPSLFQGQEFLATSPFQYFTDHEPELGRLVTEGRTKEFGSFKNFGGTVPDPQDEATFQRSKLNWSETGTSPGDKSIALYRTLLRIRMTDPVLTQSRRQRSGLQSFTAGAAVAVIVENEFGVRAIVANFGDETATIDLPTGQWAPLFATSEPAVGGNGSPPQLGAGTLTVPPLTACIIRLATA